MKFLASVFFIEINFLAEGWFAFKILLADKPIAEPESGN